MELPDDILMIIREYSKPLTRPDWRLGSYFNRIKYYVLGGIEIPFGQVIFTAFRIAFLNYVTSKDFYIYNTLYIII
jgi:hypothetical protein